MTEPKNRRSSYGRSRSGVELTEEAVEKMASKAEKGLDVSKLRRRVGRPAMGSGPAEGLPIRFDPELREALEQRAKKEGVSAGEVVRRAVRKYLRSA
jgi:CRISPR-associated endonuclease/helicase Cas3